VVASVTAFVLACIVALHPEMVAREAELAELTDAIVEASASREDAAALVAVAYWETGRTFRIDVVGDGGRSVSPWQLWSYGERRRRLAADLHEAAREALWRLRASEKQCRRLDGPNRWAEYTSGRCQTNRESRVRWRTTQWLLEHIEVEEWQA
jgi:hypothetical protein